MAPVDRSPAEYKQHSFSLVCTLRANDVIPVHKYKSEASGLTVVIAEVEGPVVNGYFTLATETHDDDGLPHTLEHLIFLGSEKYPYKGILDLVANRCLASGTNAWTDTDHTCYTVTTAGSEGFLSLMPIYIDHILYPTLTESAYITEVHHVTEDGEDAGVVYCESQGAENTGESLTLLEMLRAIYPGDCGYKSETRGIMKNLRESTSNEKVRNYHKKYYRPENLTLIVTGQVRPEDVFSALQQVEEKILSKPKQESFTRPWQSPVPPFTESVDLQVPFPCDEEDNGMVYIGWRGPSAVLELYKMTACTMLLKYLTDTSVSPLQKEFVEIEDPYASKVSFSISENSVSVLYIIFENVPKKKLTLVKEKLFALLQRIANGEENLDMGRLKTVIRRQILETLSHMENSPHDSIAFMVIGDLLFGNTIEDFDQRLNQIKDFYKMEEEPEKFWIDLLKTYLVDAPSVTARGTPSLETLHAMAEEERKRIQDQKEKLGENGLKEKGEILRQATKQNEIPPPEEMLTSVAIPSADSINFHPIQCFTSDSVKQHTKFNLTEIPIQMHLDDVHTNFVYIFVLMNTADVSRHNRLFLPILLDALLELPVQRGNVLVPYEDIVTELEKDTVNIGTQIGLEPSSRFECGAFSHTSSLLLQVEPGKYERAVNSVREILYQTVFTVERLKIIATKIVNDVAQAKRQGNSVAKDIMRGLCYNLDSNHQAVNMLAQQKFLTNMLERLDSKDTSIEVLREIESVRQVLTDPKNLVVHLATNVDQLTSMFVDVARPWKNLLPHNMTPIKSKLSVTPDWTMLLPFPDGPSPSCIVGLGCIESTFFSQTTPTITNFDDPDLAPLLVFLQYLTQLEGPMWKSIRGLGLSYGYRIMPNPNEGLLYLTFYSSANCVGAYKEAKSIVEAQLQKDAKWDETLLASAKSSLIFEIIEREKSIGDVVTQSLLSYFKNVDHSYNRNLVQKISKVTSEGLGEVGQKYVAQLFDSQKCRTSLVCHPSKVEEIATGLKQFGLNLIKYPTYEESFQCKS